jgi:hypothetical protein
LFVVGKIEDPPTGRSGRTTRDESENAREFLWSIFPTTNKPVSCGFSSSMEVGVSRIARAAMTLPSTGRSGRTTRDESENAREFLWSLRHNSIRELFPTLCGGFTIDDSSER